jgi:nitric oxide synthase-interacting protein
LAQNGKLKKQKAEYERQRLEVENRRAEWEEKERKKNQDRFVQKDQGAMASSTALVVRSDDTDTAGRRASTSATAAASAASSAKSSQSAADRKVKVVENSLEHVSYWLATSQPEKNKPSASGQFDYEREIQQLPPPPPERPSSPMSGEPLKLKQLIPLNLVREGDEDGKSKKSGNKDSNTTGRILCAVSHKTITTQPTIVIKNTGQVMLKSVYKELAQPEMVCPITGKKFKEKDVIQLVSGKSGFAASGDVVAKKYHPTLT